MNTELATSADVSVGFLDSASFEYMQRVASALSKSQLIPVAFQNNLPNCLIALEMAKRLNASPLAVMQQLYVVHGKPSWSATFIIACINSSGRFSPLSFQMDGEGEEMSCHAFATRLEDKAIVEGPPVSIAMAKKEGWFGRNGSKWQTMPQLMLRYRAATFFGRLYAPEMLMGMHTSDEIEDMKIARARTITKPDFAAEPENLDNE